MEVASRLRGGSLIGRISNVRCRNGVIVSIFRTGAVGLQRSEYHSKSKYGLADLILVGMLLMESEDAAGGIEKP